MESRKAVCGRLGRTCPGLVYMSLWRQLSIPNQPIAQGTTINVEINWERPRVQNKVLPVHLLSRHIVMRAQAPHEARGKLDF